MKKEKQLKEPKLSKTVSKNKTLKDVLRRNIIKLLHHIIYSARSINTDRLRSSLMIAITVMGSIGSATAIFTIPEIRSFLKLGNPQELSSTVSSNWNVYKLDPNFEISYPNNWTFQNTKDPIDGTQLRIMPLEKEKTAKDVYISVVIQPIEDSPLSLKEYQSRVGNLISTYLDDGRILNESETAIGGSPAVVTEYKGNVDGLPVKFIQAAAFEKDNLFIITYSAPLTEFKRFQKLAWEIMNSFTIEK